MTVSYLLQVAFLCWINGRVKGAGQMRAIGVVGILLLASCGARYHSPPGLTEADSVGFHNALGERRWCTSPNPASAGEMALNILGGGLGGAIGSSPAMRRAQYEDCASGLRAEGYVLLSETPTVTAEELQARRAQEAAEAAADTARRNAMR